MVYLVRENSQLKTIVIPVHGKGLFSTLYGFIALEADLQTIVGLNFYEHGETPGLGGEIENPLWLSKWPGKKALDASGEPIIKLVKDGADSNNEVDALSGATWTSPTRVLDQSRFGSAGSAYRCRYVSPIPPSALNSSTS